MYGLEPSISNMAAAPLRVAPPRPACPHPTDSTAAPWKNGR